MLHCIVIFPRAGQEFAEKKTRILRSVKKDFPLTMHFWAINGVNLTINPGEAIGIIGRNGAGKSTLLKLLSRVTTPTIGRIEVDGRISSMLEVGSGFHGEMTGRENVYMNGAILGMTKSEIDEKMDDIIQFSEIGEFIDTLVKRYSSGMYVKLAFAVAAHLDSEIMIMDEVLAVGDMMFQKKCLDKMKSVSQGIKTPIQAYCGGGKTGKNETSLAKQVAEYYGDIDLHIFEIGKDALQDLPHIVYILQGLSYERGCFMHYRMSKLFQEHGIKCVYTGDMADEASCAETYRYSWNTIKRIIKMDLRGVKYVLKNSFDYYAFPFRRKYDIASLVLVKKSGQIWNHFGVKGIYPFARKAFLSLARTTAIDGDYRKTYHRNAVKHVLHKELADKIKHDGGNTDPCNLFDEQSRKVIYDIVKKKNWYFDIHFPDINHQYDYYIKAMMIDIFRRIYVEHEYDEDIEHVPSLSKMYANFDYYTDL